ncbi:MAG: Fe-S cluster assembly protein SufD [Proteobacteria bacterium]|nr:Fe-S cluster assembly protein SufD [Pseudomonadota bacterium]
MSALLDSLASGFSGNDARRAALDAALACELPTRKSERWKYTSLHALAQRRFERVSATTMPVDATVLAHIPAPRIVFVNGRHDAALSDTTALPAGIELQPLDCHANLDGTTANHLPAPLFDRADEVFARLNVALAEQGVALHAKTIARATVPIHLVFLGAPTATANAWHARVQIVLDAGAHMDLVEHHLAAGTHAHLGNLLTQARLDDGARLRHLRIQHESAAASLIARTDASLARDAEYRRLDLELGAGLSRHEFNVRLDGNAARLFANGVLLADGARHLDTRLSIEHIARDTACDLLWRGMASDRAHAVFHGGITIHPGADGADARLSNKNLLLSANAEIDTQPVLEIHADEVKAAHGATVGQLDETALFYLRSRGIPAAQARALLTGAFCRQALAVLEDAGMAELARQAVDAALERIEAAA